MIAVLVVVGFMILASVIGGLNVGASLYYSACEGKIAGGPIPGKGYDNPRCTILATNVTCELTTYEKIAVGDDMLPVCVWQEAGVNVGGKTINCFLNPKMRCKDFSQDTIPKCSEVPDCRPVSSIKAAIERLKPNDRKQ